MAASFRTNGETPFYGGSRIADGDSIRLRGSVCRAAKMLLCPLPKKSFVERTRTSREKRARASTPLRGAARTCCALAVIVAACGGDLHRDDRFVCGWGRRRGLWRNESRGVWRLGHADAGFHER